MKLEVPQVLAVYGTLKRHYHNNRLLQHKGVTFLGEFKTEPRFTMVSCGGFPAVHCTGNTSIQCELYKVKDADVLRNVFRLEGFTGIKDDPGNWYNVEEIKTPHGKALMFVFPGEPERTIIQTGNW